MDAKFVHADNEDSDQTVRMRMLIWDSLVAMSESTFSQCGSNALYQTADMIINSVMVDNLAPHPSFLHDGESDLPS